MRASAKTNVMGINNAHYLDFVINPNRVCCIFIIKSSLNIYSSGNVDKIANCFYLHSFSLREVNHFGLYGQVNKRIR